jgi:hypothetical protein
VRKQYHFWPGERRLDAWDVDRLVALTAGFPVTAVPLGDIWELDTAYWGESLTPRQIAEHVQLVNDVDPAHPIILGVDGRVMDGMHRVVRALLRGEPTIAAVRFEVQPEPDYTDCAPDELPYPDPNPGWQSTATA